MKPDRDRDPNPDSDSANPDPNPGLAAAGLAAAGPAAPGPDRAPNDALLDHPGKPPVKASRATLWTFVVTSLAVFMAGLDNLIVTTALPAIQKDLGAEIEDLEWTVNAYTLSFAVLLMFGAALGDRFGRRRIFVGGLALFTLASAFAAIAPNTEALVAARALQGAGAAALLPLSLTLLTAVVSVEKRGAALGAWGAVNGLAVAVGPLVGGAIVDGGSWQWIFWLNVPIGLALVPLARIKLSESRGRNSRLDLPGTVLISTGLLGVVFGLVRGQADGWTSPTILASLTVGVILIGVFVGWERRAPQPMVPLHLFRNRGFAAVNVSGLLMFAGIFGSIFLLTQFVQNVLGYSPLEAGLRMLPWTAMPLVVAPLAGVVFDRIGGRTLLITGLVLTTVGLGWFALIAEPNVSYAAQVPAFVICGIGMGLFFTPTAALLMASVEPHEQGVASGANGALRELGGVFGVAILSSVFASNGGYGPPAVFVDSLIPALWVGAGITAAATLIATLIPRHARTAPDTPKPTRVPTPV
ncbi:MFS transporter [Streptomyces sp. SID3343]|uniref:MFS transporter n=1 Tax=Streptomyces sp. SID3343 TaxID=2690260 RepID=UPI00136B6898|nr:MFS transporter [Streptomyces sp. SID3343]MYW00082.1 DHA2 family efflux MFS transporter permease subunit [Streptomyces sp. SID3343]